VNEDFALPLFSVIIPSYNRGQFITATLESVFAQEFRDYEVIVVDDGSTDDTARRLEPFIGRIKLLHQANQGPGAARNLGVRNANGEYIAFLDSDDLWFPWTLATYAQIIQEKDHPTLIAGTLRYFQNETDLHEVAFKPLALENYADYFSASQRGLYCGTGQMVVRRDAVLENGGFVETKINAEDHDLVMRLGTAPGFVNATAPAMIAYRQHPEAATRDLSKTFMGVMNLLRMEQEGRYPGGNDRRGDRRRILAQHVRPLTLEMLRQKEYRKAWTLYRQTFVWNLALRRFRYLAGFLLKSVPFPYG
jgi:GT2 family glycosyltransferase